MINTAINLFMFSNKPDVILACLMCKILNQSQESLLIPVFKFTEEKI